MSYRNYLKVYEELMNALDSMEVGGIDAIRVIVPATTPEVIFREDGGYWISYQEQRLDQLKVLGRIAKTLSSVGGTHTELQLTVKDKVLDQWVNIPVDQVSNKVSGLPGMPMKQVINFQKAAKAAVMLYLGYSYHPDAELVGGLKAVYIPDPSNGFMIEKQHLDIDTVIVFVTGKKLTDLKVAGWADKFSNWTDHGQFMAVEKIKPMSQMRNNIIQTNLGNNYYTLYPFEVVPIFTNNGWLCYSYATQNGMDYLFHFDRGHRVHHPKFTLVVDIEKGLVYTE